jgi:hypothetical protein
MNELRPNETIQKVLISTTSRLIGEYESDNLLITHAWPDFSRVSHNLIYTESPLSRSSYVIVFKTEPFERKPGVVLPDYSPFGDLICTYLCILFGKRFDNNGLLESIGHYHLPYDLLSEYCEPKLPQNNHSPRKDLDIPLNLVEVKRIERLLLIDDSLDKRFIQFLQTAGKFYLQALRSYERQPEVAYLHLITCGEILSNFFEYEKNDLLDEQSKEILSHIEQDVIEGHKISKFIKDKLPQVKRRFILTIKKLITDYFFTKSECEAEYAVLKKEDFEDRISAAYDLRSRYLHTGISFGGWISLAVASNAEVLTGKPVVDDRGLGKILPRVPTYFGLERIMRFSLLRFIQINGIDIDGRLR